MPVNANDFATPIYTIDPWSVIEAEFNPELYPLSEGVLALANGYLGIRSSFEEGLCFCQSRRGHYAATVFNARPHPTVISLPACPENPREIVNLPDFTCLRIFVDGDPLDLATCEIETYRRVLHLDVGTLAREATLTTPGGVRLHLSSIRFVSRRRPHIAAFRITLTSLNRKASLAIESGIDGRVANADGRTHFAECLPEADEEGWCAMRCTTCESGVEVGIFTRDELSTMDSACDASSEKVRFAGLWFEAGMEKNEPAVFTRLIAVAASADPERPRDPAAFAWRELNRAFEAGFDALLEEQAQAWREVWRETHVELDAGDGRADAMLQGVRYALFQLVQHTGAGLPVAARGLVCERASGGCSWDKSLFTLPALALLRPEEAKDIVRRRIALLPAARAKSAEMGLSGAMFPWMAGAEGEETCPLWQFSLMGLHATAAVAWGVWFTCRATGDISLLIEGGCELLLETARFWVSRVFRPAGRKAYEIRRVVGLDEYHQGVDNDYYTNAMARWNLRVVAEALAAVDRSSPAAGEEIRAKLAISDSELGEFAAIADGLHLPFDEHEVVCLEFEGADRLEPVQTPVGVLGKPLDESWTFDRLMRSLILRRSGVIATHVLLADQPDHDQRRRDFDYYDPITTHDSPLSICHHILAATDVGKRDRAADYFAKIVRLDLDNVLGNSHLGPHVSCLAGIWQCLVHGFLGVGLQGDRLTVDPALPDSWQTLETTLAWHGKRVVLRATRDGVTAATDHGEATIEIDGKQVEIGHEPTFFPTACRLAAPRS